MIFTSEQQAIIEAPLQHCLITAVAGSGKTTTLAHRIDYLLKQGVDPRRMLVLMFNRSARMDFERKLGGVCSGSGSLPEIRTFHAMGYRLYQRLIHKGALPGFESRILTESEIQYQLWSLILRHAPASVAERIKRNKKEHVETAIAYVEWVKSCLLSPAEVFDSLNLEAAFTYLPEVFSQFEQWRKDRRRISYSDMLYDPVRLLHQRPDLKEWVRNKMDCVLVDEYQDVNEIQHALLKLVSGERAKVTVVGDPDQTIYEFRGAQPRFILHQFERDFKQPLKLNLSHTFRYGHAVSLLANHLISHNRNRRDILCVSHPTTYENGEQTLVHSHACENEPEAISALLKERQSDSGRSQAVVLLRVWSQSIAIELELLNRGIAYQIEDRKGVFFTREVQSISALLHLCSGTLSESNPEERRRQLEWILRFPHIGVPESALQATASWLAQKTSNWGHWLKQLDWGEIKPFQRKRIEKIANALNWLETKTRQSAYKMLWQYFEQVDLYESIRSMALTHDQAEEKIMAVQGFMKYIRETGGSPQSLVAHLESLRQQSRSQEADEKAVLLTTIHRVKGLEWDCVLIPGLVDEVLPFQHGAGSVTDVESERRLLYVAMTRTKKELHLLLPVSGERDPEVSCFVHEMRLSHCHSVAAKLRNWQQNTILQLEHQPDTILRRYLKTIHCQWQVPERHSQTRSRHDQNDVLDGSEDDWVEIAEWTTEIREGMTLHHCLMGKGEVIKTMPDAFMVEFEDRDVRTFSRKYAGRFFSPL